MSAHNWSVGVNYTGFPQFATIASLIDAGFVSHVEILIDNFLTVPSRSIIEKFSGTPIAFHIMYSKFLEADPESLRALAAPLRTLIRDVGPLYVSDHVGRFSHVGRALPILGEYDYRRLEPAAHAVDLWQDLLGTRLLLENFPSYTREGAAQPLFYERLLKRTGAGLLFDISNAVIAAHNADTPVESWNELIDGCAHFHMGGYSESADDTRMLLDTHDRALSADAVAAACRIFSRERAQPTTLTIEFDRNIDRDVWAHDLRWAAGLRPAEANAA